MCPSGQVFSSVFLSPVCPEVVLVRIADFQSAEAPKVEERGECSEALGQGGSIWRRRREETLYLSLSLPRPSDGRSQSLVTSSPTEGTSLAQRLGTLATSLDLRGLCGLKIRAPHQPHPDAPFRGFNVFLLARVMLSI